MKPLLTILALAAMLVACAGGSAPSNAQAEATDTPDASTTEQPTATPTDANGWANTGLKVPEGCSSGSLAATTKGDHIYVYVMCGGEIYVQEDQEN